LTVKKRQKEQINKQIEKEENGRGILGLVGPLEDGTERKSILPLKPIIWKDR
jgi:hypothetical protein